MSESDIEIKSKLSKKKVKIQRSPTQSPEKDTKKITTKDMIREALKDLKTRKGVSVQAVKKYLTVTFQLDVDKYNYVIKRSLKTGVEDGIFIQVKGTGASGSFKLAAPKEKPKKKPKKTAKTSSEKASDKTNEEQKKPTKRKETKEDGDGKPSKVKKADNKEVKEKTKNKKEAEEKPKKKAAKKTMMKVRKSIGSIRKPPKMKPK